jgi:hypothetical protein
VLDFNHVVGADVGRVHISAPVFIHDDLTEYLTATVVISPWPFHVRLERLWRADRAPVLVDPGIL